MSAYAGMRFGRWPTTVATARGGACALRGSAPPPERGRHPGASVSVKPSRDLRRATAARAAAECEEGAGWRPPCVRRRPTLRLGELRLQRSAEAGLLALVRLRLRLGLVDGHRRPARRQLAAVHQQVDLLAVERLVLEQRLGD